MRMIELHTAPIDYDMAEAAGHAQLKGDKRKEWVVVMKSYSSRYFCHTRQRWFKAPAREGPSHTLTVRNIQVRPINGCKQEGRPRPLYILHKNAFLWGGKWFIWTFITKKPILHCNARGRATPYLWCLTKRTNQSPQCFIKTLLCHKNIRTQAEAVQTTACLLLCRKSHCCCVLLGEDD